MARNLNKIGENGIYKVKDKVAGKKNFYHLVMFPYPSGDLHIGHWYNFAPADVYARFKKMNGFNVLSPIGFDAFGLPAENAAIKRGIHPKDWTYKNIKTMTRQLKNIGAIYDWSRKIITSDPDYYKWTQWIFLQLFKSGLVYRRKAPANWCLKCRTVLANEQVIESKCERCGSEVIQKNIEQWLFKITDYAEGLLKDLDGLDWPEKTKTMQRNWIGRSEGAMIKFNVRCQMPDVRCPDIEVFTTRADTVFGATYVVVAPEHPLIGVLGLKIRNFEEVKKYVAEAAKKSELQRTDLAKEKTGVKLEGIEAVNPLSGKKISVFSADYVLGHYGTGAVMAVPAHDQRDFEFAMRYNLAIKQVITPQINADLRENKLKKAFEEDGYMVASGEFTGLKSAEGRKKIVEWLEKRGLGSEKVNYKLRDWLVSRQRYWGAPIPIVYCDKCGIVPVSEKNLPIKLPNVKNYLPTEEGRSPLAKSEKFVKTKCPKCGLSAKRETDTMDTFVCSSWYYLRYADPKNSKRFVDPKKIKAWLPVDVYIGGAEHSVLHLLYARFFTKALYDMGFLSFKEPFLKLRHQGIILGPDGQKMSKSRGNVIDPDELVEKFGSDCVRMYLCFMGPYDQGGLWNPTGILGIKRFLERVYRLTFNIKRSNIDIGASEAQKLKRILHQTVKKTTEDIENFRFNTAVSSLMILFNEMEKNFEILKFSNFEIFLKLLSPFAPYLTEDLWRQLGNKKLIHQEKWPIYDPKLIKEEKFELIIQINGKMREKISVDCGVSQKEAEKLVLEQEKVKNILGDRRIKKIIFVPDRLINIVI